MFDDDFSIPQEDSPYTIMKQEREMIIAELKGLDDHSLIDECEDIANKMGVDVNVYDALYAYYNKKRITKEHRKVLEDLYILTHTEIVWGDDGKILHFR